MPASKHTPNLAVNLDVADRSAVITAACCQLYNLKQTAMISAWRQRAADWDFMTLLYHAQELGVELRQGNEVFHLPKTIHHR